MSDEKIEVQVYDPPSGWRYGFPKPIPERALKDGGFKKWLEESDYPKKDIDFAMKYGRSWNKTISKEEYEKLNGKK